MSTERDELAEDIRGLGITVIDGPPVDLSEPLAQHLHNLGYRKPRTITDHYEDNGTESLAVGSVIVSHGETLLAQSDGTFADPSGSTWDFWELELPITVLYEPESQA